MLGFLSSVHFDFLRERLALRIYARAGAGLYLSSDFHAASSLRTAECVPKTEQR